MISTKTFVIHVKGHTEREKFVTDQLKAQNIEAEFILEGNKEDLTPEILEKYFTGPMKAVQNGTSCVYKHLRAYEKMVERGIDLALILEDDIEFYPEFSKVYDQTIREIKERRLSKLLVSYEDSHLIYIKGSEKKDGQLLYKRPSGRMAGAYLVDLHAAKVMLDYIKEHKVSTAVDWYHNLCSNKGLITIYWCDPPIAIQGSLNGKLPSLLDDKTFGTYRRLSFRIQRLYKRLLFKMQ